jgi:hypothetical protein
MKLIRENVNGRPATKEREAEIREWNFAGKVMRRIEESPSEGGMVFCMMPRLPRLSIESTRHVETRIARD